ncbi:MAG: hypothetical protein ACI4RR_09365 [Eubacterium sp.]
MTKPLLKKQMMEVFSWIYQDKKTGKNRSKKNIISYSILYIAIFGFLAGVFFNLASKLCSQLEPVNLSWLFFAMMGLIALAFGVFGSVFNTYSSLYTAKDNDLLLSMPIKPSGILIARLSGVYAMGLMYELIVMIPTLIAYYVNGANGILSIIFGILCTLVLSVFVLALSCVLGWVVALVQGKIKNKSFVTVFISLAFLFGYYYAYNKAYLALQYVVANAENVSAKAKIILYPFYHMGLAAQGNALSMLIFTAVVGVIFAAVYLVLSRSFIRLATTSTTSAKTQYREKAVKTASADSALLRKEFKRFTSSPAYMLNCGLGTVLLIAAGIAVLVKRNDLMSMLTELFSGYESFIPLLAVAAICMMTTMNDITAPSISLEGKNLWLAQVLPVSSLQILKAKLKLHIILTVVPALILTTCMLAVIKPSVEFVIITPVIVVLFVVFSALLGLSINLKMPNLNWTNETVAVKQSMSVLIALFGGWAIVIALGLIYFAVERFISDFAFLVIAAILFAVLSAFMFNRLKKNGTKLFEAL